MSLVGAATQRATSSDLWLDLGFVSRRPRTRASKWVCELPQCSCEDVELARAGSGQPVEGRVPGIDPFQRPWGRAWLCTTLVITGAQLQISAEQFGCMRSKNLTGALPRPSYRSAASNCAYLDSSVKFLRTGSRDAKFCAASRDSARVTSVQVLARAFSGRNISAVLLESVGSTTSFLNLLQHVDTVYTECIRWPKPVSRSRIVSLT